MMKSEQLKNAIKIKLPEIEECIQLYCAENTVSEDEKLKRSQIQRFYRLLKKICDISPSVVWNKNLTENVEYLLHKVYNCDDFNVTSSNPARDDHVATFSDPDFKRSWNEIAPESDSEKPDRNIQQQSFGEVCSEQSQPNLLSNQEYVKSYRHSAGSVADVDRIHSTFDASSAQERNNDSVCSSIGENVKPIYTNCIRTDEKVQNETNSRVLSVDNQLQRDDGENISSTKFNDPATVVPLPSEDEKAQLGSCDYLELDSDCHSSTVFRFASEKVIDKESHVNTSIENPNDSLSTLLQKQTDESAHVYGNSRSFSIKNHDRTLHAINKDLASSPRTIQSAKCEDISKLMLHDLSLKQCNANNSTENVHISSSFNKLEMTNLINSEEKLSSTVTSQIETELSVPHTVLENVATANKNFPTVKNTGAVHELLKFNGNVTTYEVRNVDLSDPSQTDHSKITSDQGAVAFQYENDSSDLDVDSDNESSSCLDDTTSSSDDEDLVQNFSCNATNVELKISACRSEVKCVSDRVPETGDETSTICTKVMSADVVKERPFLGDVELNESSDSFHTKLNKESSRKFETQPVRSMVLSDGNARINLRRQKSDRSSEKKEENFQLEKLSEKIENLSSVTCNFENQIEISCNNLTTNKISEIETTCDVTDVKEVSNVSTIDEKKSCGNSKSIEVSNHVLKKQVPSLNLESKRVLNNRKPSEITASDSTFCKKSTEVLEKQKFPVNVLETCQRVTKEEEKIDFSISELKAVLQCIAEIKNSVEAIELKQQYNHIRGRNRTNVAVLEKASQIDPKLQNKITANDFGMLKEGDLFVSDKESSFLTSAKSRIYSSASNSTTTNRTNASQAENYTLHSCTLSISPRSLKSGSETCVASRIKLTSSPYSASNNSLSETSVKHGASYRSESNSSSVSVNSDVSANRRKRKCELENENHKHCRRHCRSRNNKDIKVRKLHKSDKPQKASHRTKDNSLNHRYHDTHENNRHVHLKLSPEGYNRSSYMKKEKYARNQELITSSGEDSRSDDDDSCYHRRRNIKDEHSRCKDKLSTDFKDRKRHYGESYLDFRRNENVREKANNSEEVIPSLSQHHSHEIVNDKLYSFRGDKLSLDSGKSKECRVTKHREYIFQIKTNDSFYHRLGNKVAMLLLKGDVDCSVSDEHIFMPTRSLGPTVDVYYNQVSLQSRFCNRFKLSKDDCRPLIRKESSPSKMSNYLSELALSKVDNDSNYLSSGVCDMDVCSVSSGVIEVVEDLKSDVESSTRVDTVGEERSASTVNCIDSTSLTSALPSMEPDTSENEQSGVLPGVTKSKPMNVNTSKFQSSVKGLVVCDVRSRSDVVDAKENSGRETLKMQNKMKSIPKVNSEKLLPVKFKSNSKYMEKVDPDSSNSSVHGEMNDGVKNELKTLIQKSRDEIVVNKGDRSNAEKDVAKCTGNELELQASTVSSSAENHFYKHRKVCEPAVNRDASSKSHDRHLPDSSVVNDIEKAGSKVDRRRGVNFIDDGTVSGDLVEQRLKALFEYSSSDDSSLEVDSNVSCLPKPTVKMNLAGGFFPSFREVFGSCSSDDSSYEQDLIKSSKITKTKADSLNCNQRSLSTEKLFDAKVVSLRKSSFSGDSSRDCSVTNENNPYISRVGNDTKSGKSRGKNNYENPAKTVSKKRRKVKIKPLMNITEGTKLMRCFYGACNFFGYDRDFKEHINNCSWKPLSRCAYCEFNGRRTTVNKHCRKNHPKDVPATAAKKHYTSCSRHRNGLEKRFRDDMQHGISEDPTMKENNDRRVTNDGRKVSSKVALKRNQKDENSINVDNCDVNSESENSSLKLFQVMDDIDDYYSRPAVKRKRSDDSAGEQYPTNAKSCRKRKRDRKFSRNDSDAGITSEKSGESVVSLQTSAKNPSKPPSHLSSFEKCKWLTKMKPTKRFAVKSTAKKAKKMNASKVSIRDEERYYSSYRRSAPPVDISNIYIYHSFKVSSNPLKVQVADLLKVLRPVRLSLKKL